MHSPHLDDHAPQADADPWPQRPATSRSRRRPAGVCAALLVVMAIAGAFRPDSGGDAVAATPAGEAGVIELDGPGARGVHSAGAIASTRAACAKPYKVLRGDYWIRIARNHKVTLRDLLGANKAKATTPLYPGRSICLPSAARPAAAPPSAIAPTTTTPTTTTSPTTTTTAPARTYTRDEVIKIIRSVFPDDIEETAIRIATRESNLRPDVRNSCCFGLFQIYFNVHKGWLSSIGVTSSAQLFDPLTNAIAAKTLYDRAGGWGPWGGG